MILPTAQVLAVEGRLPGSSGQASGSVWWLHGADQAKTHHRARLVRWIGEAARRARALPGRTDGSARTTRGSSAPMSPADRPRARWCTPAGRRCTIPTGCRAYRADRRRWPATGRRPRTVRSPCPPPWPGRGYRQTSTPWWSRPGRRTPTRHRLASGSSRRGLASPTTCKRPRYPRRARQVTACRSPGSTGWNPDTSRQVRSRRGLPLKKEPFPLVSATVRYPVASTKR